MTILTKINKLNTESVIVIDIPFHDAHYFFLIIIVHILFSVPLSPTGFKITQQMDTLHYNTTITFKWDPPPGVGPEAIVDYYPIIVTPRPLSHPVSNRVYSTPWIVTLDYNIVFTATITAVNCAGESSPFVLTNIKFSEF